FLYLCYSLRCLITLPPSSVFLSLTSPPTTEVYTLSLHDALPICGKAWLEGTAHRSSVIQGRRVIRGNRGPRSQPEESQFHYSLRSEEHTSELQSLAYLVCRLLLEKKKTTSD